MDGTDERPPEMGQPTPVEPLPVETVGSRGGHRYGLAIAISLLVVALVATGVLALVIIFPGHKSPSIPRSARELRASVRLARTYLNQEGRSLSSGKNRDATIYSVDLKLTAKQDLVSGYEYVLYTNRSEDTLSEVVFRVYPNAAEVRGSGEQVKVTRVMAAGSDTRGRLDGSFLSVTVPGGLAPGRQVLISFYFQEHVPQISDELGLQSLLGTTPPGGYGIFGQVDEIYNLGYAFPMVTRFENGQWESREVPPYGDPGDFECSYFTVNVDVPDTFTVAASGIRTAVGGGSGRHSFKYTGGPMRDFSVQASLNYRTTRVKEGDTELTSYYSKNTGDSAEKILEYARQSVRQYNKHFGAYPYRRLNICEAPLAGGAAGMEFSGQIFIGRAMYGDLGIKLPEQLKDLGGKQTEDLLKELTGGLLGGAAEFTVAHEVCHQWWGMVVGSDPIGHAWQDEALTNYGTVMYFRWQYGAEEAKQQLDNQLVSQYWAGSTMGKGDVVVDQPVEAFGDQFTYTAAVYGKGALFFEALEQMIGEGAFEKDLRSYYEKYSFEVATPEDLLNAFKAKPSDPEAVAALSTRWLKEKHGSEDIVMDLPGGGVMNDLKDLMDELPDMDLGPLEDWLKDLMDGGTTPEEQSSPQPPSTSPVLPI
jgi:hypothetical protein